MKVLFIGNSHTYVNNMPLMFKKKVLELGIDCHVTMIAHPGWSLEKHNANPEVKFNILYGDYDYVVCQEHAHPFGPIENFFRDMRIIKSYIDQTNSKMVIYPTWAPKDNPFAQTIMSDSHKMIAEELSAMIAPVDIRWTESLNKHPEINLFGPDGAHASVEGSNLIATAIFDTIINDYKIK